METILVTGGSGLLGRRLVPELLKRGHRVRLLGRKPGDPAAEHFSCDLARVVDRRPLEGVTRVIHAASSPWKQMQAVDIEGTRRLLSACDGGVRNFVYVSITGVDRIPLAYYRVKYAAEQIVAGSGTPYTIVRATQFYPFVNAMLEKLPVCPRQVKLQPIDLGEAVERIIEATLGEAQGMLPEAGGPEVLTLGEIKDMWDEALGYRKFALPIPILGAALRGLSQGSATCPGGFRGQVSWKRWLKENIE